MDDGPCTSHNGIHLCSGRAGHAGSHTVLVSWPNERVCSAVLVLGSTPREYPCVLDRGHDGPHTDSDGDHWEIRDAAPGRSRECRKVFRHPGTGELQRCNIVAGHIGGHQKIPLGHDAADHECGPAC